MRTVKLFAAVLAAALLVPVATASASQLEHNHGALAELLAEIHKTETEIARWEAYSPEDLQILLVLPYQHELAQAEEWQAQIDAVETNPDLLRVKMIEYINVFRDEAVTSALEAQTNPELTFEQRKNEAAMWASRAHAYEETARSFESTPYSVFVSQALPREGAKGDPSGDGGRGAKQLPPFFLVRHGSITPRQWWPQTSRQRRECQ